MTTSTNENEMAPAYTPVDVEQRLADMEYKGEGDASVHSTQLSVTASMLSSGAEIDDVDIEADERLLEQDPYTGTYRLGLAMYELGASAAGNADLHHASVLVIEQLAASTRETIQIADLRLDPSSRRVWRGAREVELSKTEFDLLELLVRNQGMVLEHSIIYDRIWGYDFGPDSKNLAVYISYLRRKLEATGESKIIHTIRGVGYSVRPS